MSAQFSRAAIVGPITPGEKKREPEQVTEALINKFTVNYFGSNCSDYEPRAHIDDRSYYERTFARRR